MLSFDSSLEQALETSSTESFWVLKLYYNAEGSSDFIGVSDKDRTDGSDIYYGIIASWGGLSQSLDFFNFTTSTLSMSISLINTDNTINGGRFSDLLSSNNFANRKWELFQNTSRHDTYDTSARMIGCGVISGNISYTDRALSLKLLDKTSKYNKQIPSSVVDIATYPNAPEKNINKPIPIAYGDFYQKTNIGTIPTSFFDRYKQFYKSAYPAIITDQWDVGVAASEAKADSQALHTLDSENIYFYKQGYYPTLTGTIGISSNPTITLAGSSASVYVPLSSSGQGSGTVNGSGSVSSPTNAVDGDFQSKSSMVANGSTSANSDAAISYAIPKVPKLGQYSDINIITKYGTSTNLANEVDDYFEIGNVAVLSITSDSETEVGIPGIFTPDKRDAFNFEGNVTYKLYSDAENETVEIYETGAKVDFNIEGIESHQISEQYEETVTGGFSIQTQFEKEEEVITETIVRTRTKNIETPSEIDYIYYSGKGRKYHSDIASRTSYNTTDFYENPVYIIEDIIRQELSLGDSEIDETLFDASSGHLGDIFNDSVGDIRFAFSQNKFISSKDLINRISKQILSWVFISGDGKFKIRTLRRTGDYSSTDRTIDFEDIFFNSVSKTSLNGVRNDIVINYNYDYGQNQFIASVNPTADSTSTGTTVNGYNQTLKLKMDADIIDETTATKLAEAYREIFKDRKVVINFECLRAKYNDLEIGDIIKFSNWDSSIKIYGDAMGTDYYIISNITKTPNTSSIKAIKVS